MKGKCDLFTIFHITIEHFSTQMSFDFNKLFIMALIIKKFNYKNKNKG